MPARAGHAEKKAVGVLIHKGVLPTDFVTVYARIFLRDGRKPVVLKKIPSFLKYRDEKK